MHSIHLLLAFTTSSFAARLLVSIPSSPNLQNPAVLPSSTHATLSAHGQPLSALLTKSNTFSFDDVPPESYILNVHCRDYAFEPLRIDVTKNESAGGEYVQAWQTFRGNEWENKGEARGEGPSSSPVHIEVKAMAARVFYEKRGGFSVLSFLKSPMILMALFSMVLVFGMPYLLDNMDPEAKAEFEQIQKESPLGKASNPAMQLQNFDFASWMAGRSSTPEPPQPAQSEKSSGGGRQGGQGQGGGKKRG